MATKKSRKIKLNPEGSLLEKADWLMARYAPAQTPLEKKFGPAQSRHHEQERPRKIVWYIGDGLSVLLHEIGHAVLRHHDTSATWRQCIIEEVEAWLWAESIARKERIVFDYKGAEKWFNTYFVNSSRPIMVKINWRYK